MPVSLSSGTCKGKKIRDHEMLQYFQIERTKGRNMKEEKKGKYNEGIRKE
jgi:hypothetical protein